MNLDIQTAVRTIFFLLLIATGLMVLSAVRSFREASRLKFFLKKRELLSRAWKMVFYSLLIVSMAFLINNFAEPVTYRVFSPSSTASLTPTTTLSPTASLTFTATIPPTETITPEFTPTPIMPAVISQEFTSDVAPNPEAVFSPLVFARRITDDNLPIDPAEGFQNPIEEIYATFSFDKMTPGSQWTALWFREGELIFYETKPWNGASGGFGYSDCLITSDQWLPGDYEVQLFVGELWKKSGTFSVIGDPPTPVPTETLTPTTTFTQTQVTVTPSPSITITPTITYQITVQLTSTMSPTPSLTQTPRPTLQPTNTTIPSPTITPTATRRSTFFR